GIEHRRFSIDDQPSAEEANGDLWGISSAQVTKGKDHVSEIFAEFELPLVADQPGFELLSLNLSGRAFKYDTVEDSDSVWKAGLNWQISPTLKLRATRGTSYRAPGLYELYIGNQTSFLAQAIIDPCVQWGQSTNEFLRANCAAIGIPDNYGGASASATIVTGGGAGVLKPETSRAFTAGIVLTPTETDFSIAVDYFRFEVNDQVDQLGAGAILGGCLAAPVFPNAFCDLFDRNPGNHPTAPYMITEVRDSFLNVNKQTVRGYDMLFRYEKELGIGKLEIEGQSTWTTEAVELLFDSEQEDGFNTDDRRGSIGNPKFVSNLRTALERGDWTYTWFIDYVDDTHSLTANPVFTYLGFPNAFRDIKAESRTYHGASVRYVQDKWDLLLGVNNLFDAEPPTISSGIGNSRYGNVPAFATQYDWYGRRVFMRFNYKF
ncbi:MAG TPA: TonB-dependent receptor, partial [Arenimonas sp.]|nr:TonB-dependent receptor [Arenimonas sp.]